MVDPKNFREVAIDLESFKREVEPRFGLLTKLVFWLLAIVVGGGIGGGFAFYAQLGSVKDDLGKQIGGVKIDVAVIAEKVDTLSKKVDTRADAASQNRIEQALARLEFNRTAPTPRTPTPDPFSPLALTSDEVQLIRSFLGLKDLKGPPKFAAGQVLAVSAVKEIPAELMSKLPKLKGFKYLIDANGWVVFADASNRVVAVIGPPTG